MSKPIDILLDRVDWKETKLQPDANGLPHATHEGVFGGFPGLPPMRCYRLSDGRAVFHADDFRQFIAHLGIDLQVRQ